jgi:hypothetical protein
MEAVLRENVEMFKLLEQCQKREDEGGLGKKRCTARWIKVKRMVR